MNAKKILIRLLMVLIPASMLISGFYLKNQDEGDEYLVKVILENIKHLHVQPKAINDEFSVDAYTNYMKIIDFNKRFLLKEDIDKLDKYKKRIDDEAKAGTYKFFNESLSILDKRTQEAREYYTEILNEPFDFNMDEEVDFSEDIPYVKDRKEMKERWRKYLKYSTMTRLANYMDAQEEAIENKDSTVKIVPFDSLELKARKNVLDQHNDWFNRLEKLDRKERLANYVNALTTVFDPHTNYFPPADKENFDIQMSGKLEGIGAQLQEKDGYIKVVKIIPGSPSFMQGELKENDLILKVAQGNDEAVDIVGARINDAVKLIRGKKGTTVRLTVKKPDGSIIVIPIVRDVVQLEETYAKSLILDDGGRKVGYLDLPSFYSDFSRDGRTSWKDVEIEIKKLKDEGAEALIFDVRNNGGGSLHDVVKMAGMFIDEGPVVQAQARGRDPQIYDDSDGKTLWDKPLVIMVNEFSASASEILAAALQDYGRALIVGSHKTHGKGSVQNFVELNKTLRADNVPDLGSLKLTTQKFYRINGGTTQLEGVVPDIVFPDLYRYIETGEGEQDFPLPNDRIEALKYTIDTTGMSFSKYAITSSAGRVKSSPVFTKIEAQSKIWEKRSKKEVFSLNLEKYRETQKTLKKENKEYEEIFTPIEGFHTTYLSVEQASIATDTIKSRRYEDWVKNLKKDYYLYETLQIAEDLIGMSKPTGAAIRDDR